jgi:hypothetical protein
MHRNQRYEKGEQTGIRVGARGNIYCTEKALSGLDTITATNHTVPRKIMQSLSGNRHVTVCFVHIFQCPI